MRRPDPIEKFKAADAESYNSVARSFSHFSEMVSRPLAETLLQLAQPNADSRVLDVGTGSGIVARAAADAIGPHGRVVGIDLSDGLLAIAAEKAIQSPLGARISLCKSDAERLPFRDAAFDRVVSLFALLHFPNPERAIAEMIRVLKPGGRLAIGIGAGPPLNSPAGWLHRFSRLPDLLALWTGGLLVAPSHIERAVERHVKAANSPEETELAQNRKDRAAGALKLVRAAGLRNVQRHWEGRSLRLETAAEFWDLQATFSSVARKRLAAASEPLREKIRAGFDRECAAVLNRGGRLEYHHAAFFLAGERP